LLTVVNSYIELVLLFSSRVTAIYFFVADVSPRPCNMTVDSALFKTLAIHKKFSYCKN